VAEPVHVLQVIAGMGSGGAESFLMNMCEHMERDKVQVDFLLRSKENIYSENLDAMGCQVFYTASFPRHWIKNYLQTKRILKQKHYDVIHLHANALLYITPLILAKKYGVPCRIVHSHNSSMAYMWALPVHRFFKKRILKYATSCFACSEQAGKWMFENQCQYTVIRNAIDIGIFKYDQNARERIRNEYAIPSDAFVIGHVGRFWRQKNHTFLLDAFSAVLKRMPDAYLMLVGEGGLQSEIQSKVRSLGIEKHVIFTGVRKDVNKMLSAFDVFAFPSLYEGLSVVAIEAQANGLPLICSEATPTSVLFSEYSKQIPLSAGTDIWSEQLQAAVGHRYDATAEIRKAGYDINEEAKKLQEFYCEHAR